MKVQFTSTYNNEENLIKLCGILGLKCRENPDFKRTFFGCDAPDMGYIIEGIDDINILWEAEHKYDLFVENLMLD